MAGKEGMQKGERRPSGEEKRSQRKVPMDRQTVLRDLSSQIETLTRLHIQHGLQRTPGFDAQKNSITRLIRDNEIDLNRELDPLTRNLYRRYFE